MFRLSTKYAKMAEAETADYTLSEYKDAHVLVRVRVPNLKSKGKGLMSKITGGRRDLAKNADIDCEFQDRSFALTVTGSSEKGMANKKWTLSSSHLPHPIDRLKCYWTVEEGWVHVYLQKADTSDDWAIFVRKGELES